MAGDGRCARAPAAAPPPDRTRAPARSGDRLADGRRTCSMLRPWHEPSSAPTGSGESPVRRSPSTSPGPSAAPQPTLPGPRPAGADHPRHPRVGRDARGRPGRGRRRRGRRGVARRRRADPGRRARRAARALATSRSSISASHNPYHDNGIKFFGPDGDKLSDAAEEAIERELGAEPDAGAPIGRVRVVGRMLDDYVAALRARFSDLDLDRRPRPARLRQRRDLPGRPGDLPRARRERQTLANRARRPQHQRRRRLDAPELVPGGMRHGGSTSASPSTATATASSPSTGPAALADGDELIALAAVHLKAGRA